MKTISTQQALNSEIKAICDIMRRSNCAGAMQYVPELTWLLFLRILDIREEDEADKAEILGNTYNYSFEEPYRWRDWAAKDGEKRKELLKGKLGAYFEFINGELIPYLKGLKDLPDATAKQKVISQIMSGVDRVRIDTEKNFLDVIDKINDMNVEGVDDTHIFTLSQVYEGLILKMGDKGNDGGQFFTPREIIRAMMRIVDPKPGETVYDPCCGTGGFLVQAYEYMYPRAEEAGSERISELKEKTFYGREKENMIYPITLANMVLHGIENPNIWHGNTLTGNEIFGGLYQGAPSKFNVILTNPPFGAKEGKDAQTNFAYKSSSTQILFLQHIIDSLAPGGRCAMVIDEGVLFKTNENAFVQVKRKLLDECNLYCIVKLPEGVFSSAGAGVKTNILFFDKCGSTEKVWYYDVSDIKAGKQNPFTIEKFGDFFELIKTKGDSDRSWTVTRDVLEKSSNMDIKNPHKLVELETRYSYDEQIEAVERGIEEIEQFKIDMLDELKEEAESNIDITYKSFKFEQFIKRVKDGLDLEDDVEYKRVTIKTKNGGISLRDICKGRDIGTKKQYRVKKGQFLLSKIDARNGAFGIVPDEADDAIITSNFWTYDINEEVINPQYLNLLVSLPEFIDICDRASSGSTNRKYLDEDKFLKVEIPLPPIDMQEKIVDIYLKKVGIMEELQNAISEINKKVMFNPINIKGE